MPSKDAVIVEALKLPEADRLEIAEALYESLAGPADADAEQAWLEEIERRVKDLDAGRANTLSWEHARRRIMGDDSDAGAAR